MNSPGKFRRALLMSFALSLLAAPAWAGGVKPLTDADTLKECGSCHMAFQPVFLPAASWKKLLEPKALADHFGDDASLPEATRARIEVYLTANASQGFMARTEALRITETPYWQKEHRPGKIKPQAFAAAKVKSKANCQACHQDAAKGVYEDD